MIERYSFEDIGETLWTIAWSPCGTYIVASGSDKKVKLFEFNLSSLKLKKITELEEIQNRAIRSVNFSNSGEYIAAASFDASIVVYKKELGKIGSPSSYVWEIIATLEGHEHEVKSISWSPDDTVLASCSRDKSIWLWEVPDNFDEEVFEDWDCLSVISGHLQDIKCVSFAPLPASQPALLFSGSYDNTIKIWKEGEDDWECALNIDASLDGHVSTVWDLCFIKFCSQQNSIKFASCSQDVSVKIWNYNINKNSVTCLQTIRSSVEYPVFHSRAVFSIDSNNIGTLLVSGGGDNILCVYKLQNETWQVSDNISQAHAADINCVRFHPKNNSILVSTGDDAIIKIWQTEIV